MSHNLDDIASGRAFAPTGKFVVLDNTGTYAERESPAKTARRQVLAGARPIRDSDALAQAAVIVFEQMEADARAARSGHGGYSPAARRHL